MTDTVGFDEDNQAAMLTLVVRSKQEIAQGTFLFELASANQRAELPPFGAGAHVVVLTPCGLTRRYSLCNDPSERHRYMIAVKRDARGLGGSISMADQVVAGDTMLVSRPRNQFPLDATASRFVFVAGGIGITPILSMIRELSRGQRDFALVYCTRSPETTAFATELSTPDLARRTTIHHDHGDRARAIDLASLLADHSDGTHLFCCGPLPLMHAVRDLTRHWPSGTVHFEDFGTSAAPAEAADRPFTVRLARTDVTIGVPVGVSILDALRSHGIDVQSSCESGTCGACCTRLLAGVPAHRDFVLDDDDTAQIMVCVSRALSGELCLDL